MAQRAAAKAAALKRQGEAEGAAEDDVEGAAEGGGEGAGAASTPSPSTLSATRHSFSTVQLPGNLFENEGLVGCAQWACTHSLAVLINRPLNADDRALGRPHRLAETAFPPLGPPRLPPAAAAAEAEAGGGGSGGRRAAAVDSGSAQQRYNAQLKATLRRLKAEEAAVFKAGQRQGEGGAERARALLSVELRRELGQLEKRRRRFENAYEVGGESRLTGFSTEESCSARPLAHLLTWH